MLNSDMGLYLDFTVDPATGRQLGYRDDGTVSCPGLVDETRNSELWRDGRRSGATKANCEKASTAGLVESYANDQVNIFLNIDVHFCAGHLGVRLCRGL